MLGRREQSRPPAQDGAADGAADGADGWLSQVRAVYQPVVDLDTLEVVGFEALARGPVGSDLESAAALFAAARRDGLLVELDWACRLAAFVGALDAALSARLGLFVNAEPAALSAPPPPAAAGLLERVGRNLPVVLEITERALTADPAGLLRGADRARARGWRIAVDDVGADRASLALLPFLRPDVIKLDLRLVQARTTVEIAETVTAVNAQAERTDALVLAEGIETDDHARLARMMGASLGQGWLFGRPGPLPAFAPGPPADDARAAARRGRAAPSAAGPATPFGLVQDRAEVRGATKPLLVAVSRQLERQAAALGDSVVVLATFQQDRHFTSTTARRYAVLAAGSSLTAAFAVGLGPEPAAGVRGADPGPEHPLAGEWDVVVVGPHFAAALLARDVGDGGPDSGRRFDYLVTYDRDVVLAAASLLLRLVPAASPDGPDPGPAVPATDGHGDGGPGPGLPALNGAPQVAAPSLADGQLAALLSAAGISAPYGITVADARHPEMPLVWVNTAFADLTGYRPEEVLGRNCRFLQGPDTDRETVRRLHARLAAGRIARATLRNYRRDGSAFWNDVQIVPVHDQRGEVTHFVGQQHDVTERVDAQDRAQYLAHHDPLTGLANRARLHAHLTAETSRADRTGTAVALLYLDLDRFKSVNDTLGHAAGDRLLALVAGRLQAASRSGDLLARLGGDEFLLVVAGLRQHPADTALLRARAILTALEPPLVLPGPPDHAVVVGASIGVSLYPADAATADALLDHADQAMYASKAAGRHRATLWQRPRNDRPA